MREHRREEEMKRQSKSKRGWSNVEKRIESDAKETRLLETNYYDRGERVKQRKNMKQEYVSPGCMNDSKVKLKDN